MKGTRRVIGIAGGSGSGKSTLAVFLCSKHPNDCVLLHLDDYFQKKEKVPKKDEFTNWDHPNAIRFNDLYRDLNLLLRGKAVTVLTKSELYNPNYKTELRNKIKHLIEPRPIILLEGYLAFWDPRIRKLMDLKIFLDMPIKDSAQRRSANKFAPDQAYVNEVLEPMYRKFVAPTKQYADLVIDVTSKNKEEVLNQVETKLFA